MTLRDRYPQLRDPELLKRLVTRAVYATMALEDQEVPFERVAELVERAAQLRGLPPTPTAGAAA